MDYQSLILRGEEIGGRFLRMSQLSNLFSGLATPWLAERLRWRLMGNGIGLAYRSASRVDQPSEFEEPWLFRNLCELHAITSNRVGKLKAVEKAATGQSACCEIDIGLATYRSPADLWHEFGHYLEISLPGLREAAIQWRSSKLGRGSAFVSEYVNRRYYGDQYTEVISMGLGYFLDGYSMSFLAQKDREHMAFMLGVLALK